MPEIDLSLLAFERTATFAGILKERINNTWGKYIQIYTDGAQGPRTGKSGFAFCIAELDVIKYKRLSEAVSVYTTELLAIIWAMQWAEEVRPGPVVICSDYASVMMTLREGGLGARSDLMVELLTLMYRIEGGIY